MSDRPTNVTLLDGGMGTTLKDHGLVLPPTIWSAAALLEAPDVVRECHIAFIDAGADLIISNTYATVPNLLALENLGDKVEDLVETAMRLAREARESAGDVRIAGSLAPLGHSYRPDLVGPDDRNLASYRRIVEAMGDVPDVLLCETMSSVREASAAVTAATETGRETWVAFALGSDGTGALLSGEPAVEAATAMMNLGVDTVLFNCSEPEAISAAIHAVGDLPIATGGYPNMLEPVPVDWSFEAPSPRGKRADLTTDRMVDMVFEWVDAGATHIGGCCGVGPAVIEAMASRIAGE
ncbi:Homocysteine S-methyltransferase-like protein [hydrothermal vent metagenome]|uniref:Homocysteine S-methyltransferase-like protein n=2 Tax=hydrothermal vent metagenome TaxID=652676 RepID=A0A3B0SJI1_9ZZZZ